MELTKTFLGDDTVATDDRERRIETQAENDIDTERRTNELWPGETGATHSDAGSDERPATTLGAARDSHPRTENEITYINFVDATAGALSEYVDGRLSGIEARLNERIDRAIGDFERIVRMIVRR